MLILSIDTSSDFLSLALTNENQLVIDSTHYLPRYHLKYLLSIIGWLFKKSGLEPASLDGVVVGTGPGSFTGLRIGAASAQALAYAFDLPIMEVPSLDAIALNLEGIKQPFHVVVDAKKSQIYYAFYECQNDRIERSTPFQVIQPELFCQKLPLDTMDSFLLVGDAIRPYRALFEELTEGKAMFLPASLWIPRARNLANIAIGNRTAFERSFAVQPIYLHSPVQKPKDG